MKESIIIAGRRIPIGPGAVPSTKDAPTKKLIEALVKAAKAGVSPDPLASIDE